MPSLQERLRRLRGASGSDADPDAAPPSVASAADTNPPRPSLAARMRRLAPARHGGRRAAPVAAETVADQLGAELIGPGLALLERRHPLTRRHGRYPLGRCLEVTHSEPGTAPDDALLATPEGTLFIDTETSGLAGGTGTWVFVAGIGRIDGAELVLRQYLLLGLDAEPAMMERVAAELATAERLISYNGKGFDLPLLETRLCLNGRRDSIGSIPHLDLLHPVRRAFATRWPDCRLATCERRLLGVGRDDDLPGAEAPAAWLDWLRSGQPDRLGAVLRHNRLDLLSLAALLPALREVQQQPALHGADIGALARHLCRRGQPQAAERLLDAHCSTLTPNEMLELARLKRRRGAWAEATALWEHLADGGETEIPALVELAKYHEHVTRDVERALTYAERLPSTVPHAHRQARLSQRLARAQSSDANDEST